MKILLFAAVAVLLAAAAACSAPQARPAAPAPPAAPANASDAAAPGVATTEAAPGRLIPITISNPSPAVSILPFYAAIDAGFFARQGLDASIVKLAGSSAQTALSKGEIDFMNSPSEAVIGARNGVPLKIGFAAWDRAPWKLGGKA